MGYTRGISRSGRCPLLVPPAFTTMHDDTADAVRALVAALMAHPEDISLMRAYGDLPQHLIDLLEDYDFDLENA